MGFLRCCMLYNFHLLVGRHPSCRARIGGEERLAKTDEARLLL